MSHNIYLLKEKYLEDIRKRNYSEASIKKKNKELNFFLRFLKQKYPSTLDVREINQKLILEYIDYIHSYRRKNTKTLAKTTRYALINTLSLFFRFLEKNEYIFLNPTSSITPETIGKHLPKDILSCEEVKRLLSAPDLKTYYGIRDRAILEIFYGSGLRASELIKLKLSDVDIKHSYLFIQGKGNKDRVVPITRVARYYLKKYLRKVRPFLLLKNPAEETLFLTNSGKPFRETSLSRHIHNYGVKAGIQKNVSPHILRHTCASHLISAGASLRYVQELLGHSTISSTQIYTHIMPLDLKDVYFKTHPRTQGVVKK